LALPWSLPFLIYRFHSVSIPNYLGRFDGSATVRH
jgi:hypothetical protein